MEHGEWELKMEDQCAIQLVPGEVVACPPNHACIALPVYCNIRRLIFACVRLYAHLLVLVLQHQAEEEKAAAHARCGHHKDI